MYNQNLKGIRCVLAASVFFGLTPSGTAILLQGGYPRESLMFFRFLFAGISGVVLAAVMGTDFRVTRRQLLELAFFGVFGWGLTSMLLTASIQYIPSGLATMFHFSYPMLVLIASTVLFGEALCWSNVLAVAAAVAGITFLADRGGTMSLVGIGLALASGVTYAMFVIAGKKSSYAVLPPQLVTCYFCLFCTLAYGLQTAAVNRFVLPSGIRQWGILAGAGILGCTLACYLLTIGIRILGSSRASAINTLEPVTSMLCGVLILHEGLTRRGVIGCLLIAVSILLAAGPNQTGNVNETRRI